MTLLYIILVVTAVGVLTYLMGQRRKKEEKPTITPPPIHPPQGGAGM